MVGVSPRGLCGECLRCTVGTRQTCSGSTTSSEISADDQEKIGLSPGLVRIALGYTGSLAARIGQVDRAVRAVGLV